MCAYIKAITAMLKFKKKLVQYHLQMKTKDSIEEWLIKNKIRKNIFNFFFFWNSNFTIRSFQRLYEINSHASTVYFGRIIKNIHQFNSF